jgi:hypothetical protein
MSKYLYCVLFSVAVQLKSADAERVVVEPKLVELIIDLRLPTD